MYRIKCKGEENRSLFFYLPENIRTEVETVARWMWEPKLLTLIWTQVSVLCLIFPSKTAEVMLFVISFHLRKNIIKVVKAFTYYRN